jgi:hypothetical protein
MASLKESPLKQSDRLTNNVGLEVKCITVAVFGNEATVRCCHQALAEQATTTNPVSKGRG